MPLDSLVDTRIFISHSHLDDPIGQRLTMELRNEFGDAAVWYDASKGLEGGDAWWEVILRELGQASVFIVILTPNSVASPWVRDEINIAWQLKNARAANGSFRIIPVMFERCEVPHDLSTLQVISFLPPSPYQHSFAALLTAIARQTSATIPVPANVRSHTSEGPRAVSRRRFMQVAGTAGAIAVTAGAIAYVWRSSIGASSSHPKAALSGTVTKYPLTGKPTHVVAGRSGQIWFSETRSDRVGTISGSGSITEFPVQGASWPNGMCLAPDGAIWFTEMQGNRICSLAPNGSLQSHPLPVPNAVPLSIAQGPDERLWFTCRQTSQVGSITPSGVMTLYSLPDRASMPEEIELGPDGAIWFTERGGPRIGRISVDGRITEIAMPATAIAGGLTSGPDGAIWFTEFDPSKIGRLSLDGNIHEFTLPNPAPYNGANTGQIVSGADGALWFAEPQAARIGRITTSGVVSEIPLDTPNSAPQGITVASDGAIWFADHGASYIGRIS